MERDESLVAGIEDRINELLEVIDAYGREMKEVLRTHHEKDPVAKLASFQVTRCGWLEDLGGQMEEIVRDMLDRAQNVDTAVSGRFTGRPDDVRGSAGSDG
jgi:hypothetical protein